MSRVYIGIDPGWRNIGISALLRESTNTQRLSVLKCDTLDTVPTDKPIKKLSSKDYEHLSNRLAVSVCTWLDSLFVDHVSIFGELGRVFLCIEEPFYNAKLPFMRKLFHIKYMIQGLIVAWFWCKGIVTVTKSTQMSQIRKLYELKCKKDHQKLVESVINKTQIALRTEHEYDSALHCVFVHLEESNLLYPKKA